jgi:hypothetical protein
MDDDLDGLSRDELAAEAKRLRAAVPPWPKFLRGCLRYREALERELPNAPVADVEDE